MIFQYDPTKSFANKEKHGIDFEEAQAIWGDENKLEISIGYDDEKRFIVIGMIREKIWTAVITYREDTVRIISVRRARKDEEFLYD